MITLNNGVKMPPLGMGVFRMTEDEVRSALPAALEAGYRLIDTAALYGNERAVGEVIAASGIPRDELFVTTPHGRVRLPRDDVPSGPRILRTWPGP